MAKVYLYWADWANDDKLIFDKAIPLLEGNGEEKGVLNCGYYELFNDYSKLFAAFAENNSESILKYSAVLMQVGLTGIIKMALKVISIKDFLVHVS